MPDETPPDDSVNTYWEALPGPKSKPEEAEPSTPDKLRSLATPGELVIGTGQMGVLVSIKPDGTLEYGPNYTPDRAAITFWEEMGKRRLEMEERILLFQHMEAILTRLGLADIQNESRQRLMNESSTPDNARAVANSHSTLERVVHQAIELGRGLARRPGMPMPELPERVPQQIAEDEGNSYDPT